MPSIGGPSLVLGRAYRPDRTAVLAIGDTTSPMAAGGSESEEKSGNSPPSWPCQPDATLLLLGNHA